MGTIADKLNYLEETKQSIRTAIENKGVTISDTDSFRSYGDKINNIITGEGADLGIEFDLSKITSKTSTENYLTEAVVRINKLPEEILNGTKINSMFAGFRNLVEIPYFDSSNITGFYNAFSDCRAITTIPLFNTSKVTDMGNTFQYCSNLKTIPQLDTSSVSQASSMFAYCDNLESIPLLNFGKVKTVAYILSTSTVINKDINLGGFKDLGKGYTNTTKNWSNYRLDLSKRTEINHDSLMNVINNLYDLNLTYDVANGGTLFEQGLLLGEANIARLTEDEIAIATNKGWIVS